MGYLLACSACLEHCVAAWEHPLLSLSLLLERRQPAVPLVSSTSQDKMPVSARSNFKPGTWTYWQRPTGYHDCPSMDNCHDGNPSYNLHWLRCRCFHAHPWCSEGKARSADALDCLDHHQPDPQSGPTHWKPDPRLLWCCWLRPRWFRCGVLHLHCRVVLQEAASGASAGSSSSWKGLRIWFHPAATENYPLLLYVCLQQVTQGH